MDLKALLLTQGVIVATYLSTFVGAPQLAPEPSASSPSPSSSSPSLCSRSLLSTLWGSAFAFISLMADAWPAAKAVAVVFGDASSSHRWLNFLVYAPLAPWLGIFLVLQQMIKTIRFRLILPLRVTCPELASDAQGILKTIRIVANTYIVLGVNDSDTLPSTHFNTNCSPVNEDNVAEVLTLGQKTAENLCLMVLNDAGKLALLECSILPNYKQLRFLDGRSGIATIIIAMQTTGYVASIVIRAIFHLPVSPIETTSLAFNMVVIVHSVVHRVGAICQNPLVIYLNRTQQREMADRCEATRWSNVDDEICKNRAIVGMVVVAIVLVALTIVVGWPVLRRSLDWGCPAFRKGWTKCWSENMKRSWDGIGLIFFLICLFFQLILLIKYAKYYISPWTAPEDLSELFVLIPLFTLSAIVTSMIGSILNWTQCDSRTPSLIHIVPFLG
ncbi:unnamed protein product [Sphagnum balticum]